MMKLIKKIDRIKSFGNSMEPLLKDGDIIFLQDFWTPGIEGIFYALDLYGYKNIKIYHKFNIRIFRSLLN